RIDLAPAQNALNQNFPNPFNESTSIKFELPQSSFVNLSVFDISGRHICTLIENYCVEGAHQVYWNGNNIEGLKVSGGMYVYRLRAADGTVFSRKMALIK
ncbi:MAG: T9SS type A sorting domain-containing protein, partial [Bacteroidales bacterium]|nr:T9SS type A sorting domain-containing protein [Bacteroidales bacterium]